jgi:hypothetical protein
MGDNPARRTTRDVGQSAAMIGTPARYWLPTASARRSPPASAVAAQAAAAVMTAGRPDAWKTPGQPIRRASWAHPQDAVGAAVLPADQIFLDLDAVSPLEKAPARQTWSTRQRGRNATGGPASCAPPGHHPVGSATDCRRGLVGANPTA